MPRFLALFATLFTLSASAAQAQSNCAPRAVVLDHLAQNFGETRQSIGLGQDGHVIEVFASADSGTWTITITLPNGLTCLVASGDAFEAVAETQTPDGVAG